MKVKVLGICDGTIDIRFNAKERLSTPEREAAIVADALYWSLGTDQARLVLASLQELISNNDMKSMISGLHKAGQAAMVVFTPDGDRVIMTESEEPTQGFEPDNGQGIEDAAGMYERLDENEGEGED